ncbi:hypothetical protein Q4Q34_01395 [Flavivirga abyssicola]|uniref:hypothetical protein n=1 Tax=Flavivirga abyssicola TaxID=3063533 RepID=UPI0026E0611D|nr:hypothetical protein [Flavivirga sp. MEBiC07777]WVK13693.1 hypothetical protein Q4Q34_01395 [Flavivirga sp. MEBiC07777]
MKHLIYIIIILFSIQTNGQNSTEKKQFRIDLLTVEKTTNDTIISSIIEIYSGEKRIETSTSDFDGISIFFIKSKDVIDDKIRLKIYGPKCSIFEKEYILTDDLNTKINLEYGETEYTHHNQTMEMYEKLNIKLKMFECEVVEPKIIYKN